MLCYPFEVDNGATTGRVVRLEMGCPIYLLEAHSRHESAKEERNEDTWRVSEFCNATKTAYCSLEAELCLAELNRFCIMRSTGHPVL